MIKQIIKFLLDILEIVFGPLPLSSHSQEIVDEQYNMLKEFEEKNKIAEQEIISLKEQLHEKEDNIVSNANVKKGLSFYSLCGIAAVGCGGVILLGI